jgi:nucleotide-binding universal stress UspA family protein
MFQSILVPLDGSSLAEEALPLAASLAEQHGASLSLTVVHPWGPAEDAPRPASRSDRELREAEGRYLNHLMQRVAAAYRIPVCEAVLDGAATGQTLEEYIRRRNIDLVVASTHYHGALGRFLSTGVARFLARHSRASVLFIKPQVGPLPVSLAGFRRILVAVDSTSDAEVSLLPAAALAAPEEGVITLVRVIAEDGESLEQACARAEGDLEQVAAQMRQRGCRAQTGVVRGENVAEAILAYAGQHESDLIVLTTRKRAWVSRVLFGSVADAIIRKAEVPVLVCHPTVSGVPANDPAPAR